MPTVSPENNKFIYSRITFELADAIATADNNRLAIDDALIVAATPCVLLNFKAIDDKNLKRIMTPLKRFFKHNPRFLDFSKSAVAEGLQREWLPTLEYEDKAVMLSDFILTPAVDEDGYVIFNPKVFENLTAHPHPDNERYGKLEYTLPPVRKRSSSRKKMVITTAPVIADLATKLAPYIAWYKRFWYELQTLEGYKWEAVEHFQRTFNIDAEDLVQNLKDALSKELNLLSGPMYMPKSLLIKNAHFAQDDIRTALVSLFDESKPLVDRVDGFLADFAEIHEINKKNGHHGERHLHQQSERSASVYLSFMYPNRYYLYKNSLWNEFASEVDFDREPLSNFPSKLYGYYEYCEQIRKILMTDEELLSLLAQSQPNDVYDGHILTQDFMYCIAYHFVDSDFKPRYYTEPEV